MTIRALLALLVLASALPLRAETVEWRDARWFTGSGFVGGDRYSEDGVFLAARPAKVDRVVDLGGRHAVPPFGDAHHHGIDSNDGLEDKIIVFLEAGIFYVKNPNVIPELLTPDVRARLNRRHTLDIVFSNGGLTSPGGHPVPLHEYLASLGVFQNLTPQQMEGRAWFTIADDADLDAKWPRILAGKPDFIKTFLLFSEEFEGRKPLLREDGRPNRGLDPRVLRSVVSRAHAAGLRVTTHIDTARDFENAVDAGVDEVNHLPQPDQRFSPDLSAYVITPQAARRAAARGVTVVTTASTTERLSPNLNREWIPGMRANQAANLRTLLEAGVKIAIGSDGISGERRFVTARDEVRFLVANRMLTPLELLRAWSVDTAKTIFPARRVGELAPGFEASFLVLEGDPLRDPANLERIQVRVKQGLVLPEMPRFYLRRD
jgi:cytosine/adenosine deaminase-related metal-dependent hydrolase